MCEFMIKLNKAYLSISHLYLSFQVTFIGGAKMAKRIFSFVVILLLVSIAFVSCDNQREVPVSPPETQQAKQPIQFQGTSFDVDEPDCIIHQLWNEKMLYADSVEKFIEKFPADQPLFDGKITAEELDAITSEISNNIRMLDKIFPPLFSTYIEVTHVRYIKITGIKVGDSINHESITFKQDNDEGQEIITLVVTYMPGGISTTPSEEYSLYGNYENVYKCTTDNADIVYKIVLNENIGFSATIHQAEYDTDINLRKMYDLANGFMVATEN